MTFEDKQRLENLWSKFGDTYVQQYKDGKLKNVLYFYFDSDGIIQRGDYFDEEQLLAKHPNALEDERGLVKSL